MARTCAAAARAAHLVYTISVRLRPPDPVYLTLLQRYPAAIRRLALAARRAILEEIHASGTPQPGEFIYEVYTIANHFSFTGRPGDSFIFTTTHAAWVNLGFSFGAFLADPAGLMRGDGKRIRHIRVAQPSDLSAPGVRDLIRAAIARAERPEEKAIRPGTVVHTKQSAGKRSSRS